MGATTVRDAMSPDHPSVDKATSVHDAIQVMNSNFAGSVAILETDGCLAGVLREGDIPKLMARSEDLSHLPTMAVAEEPPRKLSPDQELETVREDVRTLGELPVVEGASYIGMLTPTDLAGHDAMQDQLGDRAISVRKDISPEDKMYMASRGAYYLAGADALRCIKAALGELGKDDPRRILDWACGHGRVLRVLKAGFPEASITACDIDRAGVDFCASKFGAIPAYSDVDPNLVELAGEFDLIWSGSFFTHLPADRWDAFLRLMERLLTAGGLLVFSALGRLDPEVLLGLVDTRQQSTEMLEAYDREGFGYVEQDPIGRRGLAICSPPWVQRQICRRAGLQLVSYKRADWRPPAPRHDIAACIARPD